jgi:hypothetical protein
VDDLRLMARAICDEAVLPLRQRLDELEHRVPTATDPSEARPTLLGEPPPGAALVHRVVFRVRRALRDDRLRRYLTTMVVGLVAFTLGSLFGALVCCRN